MGTDNELPWHDIHNFLLNCGNVRDPKNFSTQVIKEIKFLVPYDQARVYYINDNGAVYDEYLVKVDKKWPRLYYEYYSKVENGRYSLFHNLTGRGFHFVSRMENCVYDWTKHQRDEFLVDYIRPQGIRFSLGFGLFDTYNTLKCTCIIDRSRFDKFTVRELNILNVVWPHLNNLYKNLYVNAADYSRRDLEVNNKSLQALTPKEKEIVNMLCSGVTPANISKKMHVSLFTVYKHISHIYEKLNVTSRQELLVKMYSEGVECLGRQQPCASIKIK
ncbi:response regulator transcription factor [Moorella sulfitireducens (nom. illeg.)]|uniref:response regulator transcription factor n=1 Tax=Neomoorella sulfitireducens TaxID=2972948 RepID=UPI0021AD25EF|nr:helix-turn-helix transcriptional regulator [Moorella sulfitireducens]